MTRELPTYSLHQISPKKHSYCVGIPLLNEGEKIKAQLDRMIAADIHNLADIIIFDGGSNDGTTSLDFLKEKNVTALLVKESSGKVGAQLRMGFNFVLEQNYQGLITIDGNNKDSVSDIPKFIGRLEEGVDFIQGSRYQPGGEAINTPLSRHLAVKYIHAPWISLLSGFRYTDTTNGFRGMSARVLQDTSLALFRHIFSSYEILFYMSIKIPRLGYKVEELPVTRAYPPSGKTPTKISFWGNFNIIFELLYLTVGKYDFKN